MSQDQADYVTEALELMGIAEPRQIITEVSGFIPVFEVLLREYDDPLTALVFGRMWQYCGMSDGVCKAKLERIADDVKVSRATVIRHIEKLCADGYMIDTTPDRRNRPHEYKDGGRVIMKNQLTAGVSQRTATVSQKTATVSERYLIKQDNTKDKTITAANIFKIYTDNIGILTPMLSDELKEIEDTYPEGWFEDAVKEAVKNNVRKLNYIKKILESWKLNGRAEKKNSEVKRTEGEGFYV